MRLVPPEARGRLLALLRTAMQASPPAGAGLAALTLGRGTPVTVAAIAAAMGLPAACLGYSLIRSPLTNGAAQLPGPSQRPVIPEGQGHQTG
jgi:hypothetical protein